MKAKHGSSRVRTEAVRAVHAEGKTQMYLRLGTAQMGIKGGRKSVSSGPPARKRAMSFEPFTSTACALSALS